MQSNTIPKLLGLKVPGSFWPMPFVPLRFTNFFYFLIILMSILMLAPQAQGQVNYAVIDNFDRTDNNALGNPSSGSGQTWVENEANATQLTINGNALSATTAGVTGNEPTNATLNLTTEQATFDLGVTNAGWSFHFDLNRNPSGWGTNNFGLGWVLAANEADLTSSTVDGYAVIWTSTNDELVLVYFENGISGLDPGTKIISTGVDWDQISADGINVRVEVDATGNWTMFWEEGAVLGTSTDINANVATGSNNTAFADANLFYSGPIWSHTNDTGGTSSGTFDNFAFGITTPSVTLASATPTGAGNVTQGTTNHEIYAFDLAIADANAILNGVNFTTTGTYAGADVQNFKLWYSTDNTFNSGVDTPLDTLTASLAPGNHSFTGFNQSIASASTGYLFITTDVSPLATATNTLTVSAIATTDLSFSGVAALSGTASAGGTQTITACSTPADVSNLNATYNAGDFDISWTNGNCYDEIFVVASVNTIAATPSGLAMADATFGNGSDIGTNEFLVFRGTGTSVTVTGLSANTTYYFKVFARKGTTWSTGIEVSGATAGALVAWDFSGNNDTDASEVATTVNTNISTSSPSNEITRGAGLTAAATLDWFRSTGFDQTSEADAITNNDYYEFTIEANAGFLLNLSSLDLNIAREGTGPDNFALRSNLDNFSTNLNTFTETNTTGTQNITLTGFTNIVGPVTFRLYGWGGSGGAMGFEGTGNDVVINGTINAISAPTISATTTALSGFVNTTGNVSPSQFFTVSAENLTADVAVNLSTTDYELSTDNITFNNSLTLTRSGGGTGPNIDDEPRLIYVRLKTGLTAGTKTATLTLSSTGATSQTITLSGTTITSRALNFVGTNDRVDLDGAGGGTAYKGIGGTSDRTVEAWIRTTNMNNQVVVRWGGTGAGEAWSMQVNGGKLFLSASSRSKTGTADIADGNWHHIAITFADDGSPVIEEAIFYVDGQVDPESARTGASFSTVITTNDVRIGNNTNSTQDFIGDIDEVRIWSVARTQAEIQSKQFCTLAGTETGLEAYFNFDQGTAEADNTGLTTLTDLTANNYNGTLSNFALIGATSNWVTGTPNVNLNREINLVGNGVNIASGSVTPTTADFTEYGNVSAGTILTRTFTIQNLGTDNLTLTNASALVSVSGSSAFTVEAQPGSATIAGGANQTFQIKFAPNNAGTFIATVTIASDDCDENPYTFVVQGTGTDRAPLAIHEIGKPVTIDFSNFNASGVTNAPNLNQLHSENWAFTGFSDGDVAFGGSNTITSGDYARGTSTGGESTGGLYAFDVSNGGTANTALGFQSTGDDFTPGTITVRLQNLTGSTISAVDLSYIIQVYNDQGRANSFNVAYSTDNTSYTDITALNFTSTETADGSPMWVANNRNSRISGLSIANNGFLYIRWTSDDVTGSGSRDEIALDDLQVTAYALDQTRTNALAMDGVGDYVDAGDIDALDNTVTFSFEGWVKFNALADDAVIVAKSNAANDRFILSLGNAGAGTNNDLLFTIGEGGNEITAHTTEDLFVTNAWYHVAVTYNGAGSSDANKIKMYVNGIERTLTFSGTAPTVTSTNAAAVNFGGISATQNLNATIEEFRLWSDIRTEVEIRENMHLTLQGLIGSGEADEGLLSYYQLNEVAGSTVANDYISGNNGTINGDPDYITSTANLGRNGVSNSQTVAAGAGTTNFTTSPDANVSIQFTAHTPTSDPQGFTVTYQQFTPNSTDPIAGVETIYQNPMWTINKAETAANFTGNITFNFPNNTFSNLVPRNYTIYNRPMNSDGDWADLNIIPSAITDNSITFNGINVTGQFMVVLKQDKPDRIRGKVLTVTGTNSNMDIGDIDAIEGGTTLTLETWVKFTSLIDDAVVIGKSNGVNDQFILSLGAAADGTNNDLKFVLGNGGQEATAYTTGDFIATNTWYHVALVYNNGAGGSDADKLKLYINGIERTLTFSGDPVPTTIPSNAANMYLGALNTDREMTGALEETRLWTTARTADIIRENMHLTLVGTETGLVSYYQFNDDANDYIGGNDGTLNSATVTVDSDVNVGRNGSSETQTSTDGTSTVTFTNSANFAISLTTAQAVATDNITATYQRFTPNSNGGITGSTILDNPIWTINKSTTDGTFTGDVTFTFPSNVFADRYVLNKYELYRRDMNAVGNWTITNLEATAITDNSITFTGFNETHIGQLMVVRTSETAPVNTRNNVLTAASAGDYIQVADDNTLDFGTTTNFTLSAWVKLGGAQTDFAGVIAKGSAGATWSGYQLLIHENNIAAEINSGGTALSTGDGLKGSSNLNDGQWHHLAMVVDRGSNNIKLYVDGVQEVDFTNVGVSGNVDNAANLNIATNRDASINFIGEIDEVRILNTAQTTAQVRENMHLTLRGDEGNLISYYQFNSNELDAIGANNGTIQGAANTTQASSVNVGRPGVAQSLASINGAGSQNFNNANLEMVFNSTTGTEDYTATYQNFAPNTTSGTVGTVIYSTPMWTINKSAATASSFDANLVFTFPNNTFSDNLLTNNYALYRRTVGGDGSWTQIATQADNVTNSTITFNNVTEVGQYMVTRTILEITASNALSFDGNNQYLSTANRVSDLLDDFTFETWVKWDGTNTGSVDRYIFYNGDSQAGTPNGYGIGINSSNQVTLFYSDGTATLQSVSTGVVLSNTDWVHLTLVRRAGTYFVYINGVEYNTGVADASPALTSVSYFASQGALTTNTFPGLIEETRFWSVARTIGQIRENMHLIGSGTEANLVANWQFNEAAGTTATDGVNGLVANYQNGPTPTNSTAPIATGRSTTVTVATSNQDVSFPTTNIRIVFGTNVPNGDVVMTQLDALPNILPNTTTTGAYWIAHNYGAVTTFSAVTTVEMLLPTSHQISSTDEATPANIKLYKRPSGSDATWPASVADATSANNTTKLLNFTNVSGLAGFTSFSQLIAGSNGTSGLPITLSKFEANRMTENAVKLDWETLSELNNKGFEIEKSENGVDFEQIGFVDGVGNSSQLNRYQFTDNDALRSAYYRLKQIDTDGKYEYSPVRFVKGGDLVKLTIYPNPTAKSVKLGFGSALQTKLPILTEIVNLQGKVVFKSSGGLEQVQQALDNQFTQMQGGTYLLKVLVGNQYYVKKVIKQ